MTPHRLFLVALAALAVGCGGQKAATNVTEVVAVRRATLPPGPTADDWKAMPELAAPLLLQDMVEPRLLVPSTREVRVRAATDGTRIAFRLEWADATPDDVPATGRFSDACAVQVPQQTQADVPAPQMGETGRPVEISYWRAYWQATVDGRPDAITAIYPNALPDHYPFDAAPLQPGSPEQEAMAKRYAPARALGNPMAGPRTKPVEDLVAEGPGTIRPGDAKSDGRGARTGTGWAVVLSRPLPAGVKNDVRGQVAFAVWDGEHQEGGARKMRTGWVPLLVEGEK